MSKVNAGVFTLEEDLLTLGLGKNASWSDVCSSYSRLIRIWDPSRFQSGSDMHTKALAKVKDIENAYFSLQSLISDNDTDLGNLQLPIIKAKKHSNL